MNGIKSSRGNAGVIGVAIASFLLLYIGLAIINGSNSDIRNKVDACDNWSAAGFQYVNDANCTITEDTCNTYYSLDANTTTGYNIGGMFPMVIVAGAMIAALMGYFAMR